MDYNYGDNMYLSDKKVWRVIRKFVTRRGDARTENVGVFTTLEKAQKALMNKLIDIAVSNIRTATTVKGAIRGNGVATVHMLADEVREHGMTIESIYIQE